MAEDLSSPFVREAIRKSLTQIRVYNPTDEDHTVWWGRTQGGVGYLIPNRNKDMGSGLGIRIVPQYIAVKYVDEMMDKLSTFNVMAAVKAENDRRESKGTAPMSIDSNEMYTYESRLRLREKEKAPEYRATLILGIEQEYGDVLPPEEVVVKPDQAAEDFWKNLGTVGEAPKFETVTPDPEPAPDASIYPTSDDKPEELPSGVFELRSLANKRGLETSKTDTKAELIAKLSQ